ncbi:MAG: acyl-CoA thioesterase [Candidatus Nanopelagicales bacterium]
MSLTAPGEVDPRDLRLSDFTTLRSVMTRWSDVDALGHVNNAVHHHVFDTAVTGWLFSVVGDVRELPALGVVAETNCRYLGELHFPDVMTVGMALERLSHRSVTYRLALFVDRDPAPVAVGRFVHVYIDPVTRRPVAVPEVIRAAVNGLGSAL